MHEGKQVKQPVSRVIQQAEGKGTQQFKLKDKRINGVVQKRTAELHPIRNSMGNIIQFTPPKKFVPYTGETFSTPSHKLSRSITFNSVSYQFTQGFIDEHPIYGGTIISVEKDLFKNDSHPENPYTLKFTMTGYSSSTSTTLANIVTYGFSNTNKITHMDNQQH
ncbi:hypothetical protein [Parabacteroides johnsonii]|uniref:Uncharacterized protein n=1 Tax=Parabacteroides johnsonii CL02T12C29 TaxID=999419 RepID=K5YWL5_9BACT|nr:hypothetical protein [Parabacteroides johnsonii]EKN07524.1 hypothetical protein HMPREF1077_02636 [Parabacteroides johnsonii CL02T12C29]